MNLKVHHQPYPFNASKKRALFTALSFGLFIFLFLFLFQPFGLTNYSSPTKVLELAGYGLVTALLLFLNVLLFSSMFPKWYSEKKWTVGKNILFTVWILFLIGFGNLLYSNALNFVRFNFNAFIFYQGVTILIGLIPISISTLIVYNKNLSKAIKAANELNLNYPKKTPSPDENWFVVPSKNKSEQLKLDLTNTLAFRAEENYIEIFWLKDNQIKKDVIRNTLKELSEHLKEFSFIQKCHRSYLVNTNQINSVSGNAQGLVLLLHNQPNFEVPVSRSYVSKLKQLANDQ